MSLSLQQAERNIGTGSVSGVNFSATVSNPLSISGTSTNGAGATVNLGGAATATTTADGGGKYSFGGLLGGNYTVTPQASGEIFAPGSQSVTLPVPSATGINFTAPNLQLYLDLAIVDPIRPS